MRQERSGGGRIQGDIHDFQHVALRSSCQCTFADHADLFARRPPVLDLARAPSRCRRADKGCPLRFPRLSLLLSVRDTVLFCYQGEDYCNPPRIVHVTLTSEDLEKD